MPPDPLIGRVFDGRYEIERKLGAGGMADVYLAEDQELGRSVAIKMLNDRHAHDEQFVERFRREAKNAAGLSHPNIVSVYDRGEADGTYYIAMEYLEGRTLKELIVRNGPTPVPIAIDYARQILSAISFAHRHGVVHRDIKPHNIVVARDGRLKVTDFGIARSGASQMTEAGSIIGTAQYLSPEQARGVHVDQRSDIYSVGIVLYEMLTGEVPFSGDSPVEIAMKHLQAVPGPPSDLNPKVPHDLDAIVLRALAKEPEARYASAEEMDADLGRVARGLAVAEETEAAATTVLAGAGIAAPTTVIRPRLAPAPQVAAAYTRPDTYYEYEEPLRRRPIWPWLLALGLVLSAGVAGWYVWSQIQEQLNASKPVTVPPVVDLRQAAAEHRLTDVGLKAKPRFKPSLSKAKGRVISQDPSAGSKTDKGNPVTIVVSNGTPKTKVPSLVGTDLADAVHQLTLEHLKYKVYRVASLKSPNSVTATAPAAGAVVQWNTRVRVNVSKGPKPVLVPNVEGQPYANALGALQGAGFAVRRENVESNAPKGTVVGTDPAGGVGVAANSTVTVNVSKGPKTVAVPDVTSIDQATAETTLRNAGFKVSVQTSPTTDPVQDGLVISEDPGGGAQAAPGSTVSIVVGELTATPPVYVPPTDEQTTTDQTTTDQTTTEQTTTEPGAETSTETTPGTTTTGTTTAPTTTTGETTTTDTTADTTTEPAQTSPVTPAPPSVVTPAPPSPGTTTPAG